MGLKEKYRSFLLGAGSVICLHPDALCAHSASYHQVMYRMRNALSGRDSSYQDAAALRGDVVHVAGDFTRAHEQEIAKEKAPAGSEA